ncbi:MAG: phosphatidylserine decarboxylase, partial [Clostridia bacterium]|nr:phosphatidylserine decarboxylase [Clostridia bacterium]
MAKNAKESGSLHFLYETVVGRVFLKILCAPWVSKLIGWYMNTALSKAVIKKFIENNHIDLSEYESDDFRCFNDCFSRKIKEGLRPIQGDGETLVAPCDGLLSAYHIQKDTVIPVKQSQYTLSSLLHDETLCQTFEDGICLVFRLCVHHYHRYCYPIDGTKGKNTFIPGRLHTVRPIALRNRPVFSENSREYTVINSPVGPVLQMEVGAMLVGKILNHHGAG